MAGARTSSRSFGKSDDIDACSVARAALREPGLPAAQLAGPERDLKLLVDHREDLVAQRTAIQQRLRWHLHDLDPAIEVPERALDRKVWLDRVTRKLQRKTKSVQVEIAKELVSSCRSLTRRIESLARQIAKLVDQICPELLSLSGCGVLTAAKVYAEVGGIQRFRTEAKLAVHAGAAPLEASSGSHLRHRLNRHGNRQLNVALHRIAVTQGRIHEPAMTYLKKKQAEGKSRMEALRCLKRHLAGVVFRILKAIQRRASLNMSNGQVAPQTAFGLT
jgi:transposase